MLHLCRFGYLLGPVVTVVLCKSRGSWSRDQRGLLSLDSFVSLNVRTLNLSAGLPQSGTETLRLGAARVSLTEGPCSWSSWFGLAIACSLQGFLAEGAGL